MCIPSYLVGWLGVEGGAVCMCLDFFFYRFFIGLDLSELLWQGKPHLELAKF